MIRHRVDSIREIRTAEELVEARDKALLESLGADISAEDKTAAKEILTAVVEKTSAKGGTSA